MKKTIVFSIIILLCSLNTLSEEITLVWDAPSNGSDPEGYRFYVNYSVGINLTTTYIVDPIKRYFFTVTSFNEYGESEFSNVITYPEVKIISILYEGDNIQLTWRSTEEDVFRLESSDDLVNWTVEHNDIPSVPGTVTSWLINGVLDNIKFYRVVLRVD